MEATEHIPIRTIASLTGVKAITLRAWERRYGLIRPIRTPKGHRLYTQQHVELIHRVLDLVDRGVAIGQVRKTLEDNKDAGEALRGAGPWREYKHRMARAIASFNESALDEVYDEALSLHSVQRVTRLLLSPLLIHLGRRWKGILGGVAEEHFFAVYLRNKLGARLHHRRRLATGPSILAACAPGELHEIGLLLFTLAAHESGLRVISLGADTPLAEVAIAVRRAGCSAAVISSSMPPATGLLERDLPALVQQLEVPVFLGGTTSVRHRGAIAAAGAFPIGSNIDTGVRAVNSALGSRRN
jgi:MerR family transcriptional regulator, light-induced transcriptional regulator